MEKHCNECGRNDYCHNWNCSQREVHEGDYTPIFWLDRAVMGTREAYQAWRKRLEDFNESDNPFASNLY